MDNIYVIYIIDNINDLNFKDKVDILYILIDSQMPLSKIIEKGSGTQIKFDDMSDKIIYKIYNFIYNRINLESNILLNLENLII
jgi:hypothetical protein